MTNDEILECCEQGYALGYRSFVLQGGEDPYYTDEIMVRIIEQIKREFSDCALTLSIGEKTNNSYRMFRKAGADRYLLRQETAEASLYRSIHPDGMCPENRKRCLSILKELGYQTGAGFMVGLPGQQFCHIASDLIFLQELQPQMVGIGPFIPHHDTVYANEKAGSIEMTLFLLSIIRIMLPKALIPATTALGTLDVRGREKALAVGANVVMPNLSPVKNRKMYKLYDNKICTGEKAAECKACISRRVESVGYKLVVDRGDAVQ